MNAPTNCSWTLSIVGPISNLPEQAIPFNQLGLAVNAASFVAANCSRGCYQGGGSITLALPANNSSANRAACLIVDSVSASGNINVPPGTLTSGFNRGNPCPVHVTQIAGP